MSKYTMSDKRVKRDLMQADLDKRIDILMKRNQGWTFEAIGEYYNQSFQSIHEIYQKIKDLSISELEDLRRKADRG
jgi:hypothetical protein